CRTRDMVAAHCVHQARADQSRRTIQWRGARTVPSVRLTSDSTTPSRKATLVGRRPRAARPSLSPRGGTHVVPTIGSEWQQLYKANCSVVLQWPIMGRQGGPWIG